MQHATLCFLIKRNLEREIAEVCLAMKKRGFGKGHWNGTGGKVDNKESIEQALVRETKEEIIVDIKEFQKVAEIRFSFVDNPEWDQIVHSYFCEEWNGEPSETEEMYPEWFLIKDIPYEQMWVDDKFWLPKVLNGEIIQAEFEFYDSDSIKHYEINPARY